MPGVSDVDPDQVDRCCAFLASAKRTKTARYSSYALKHVIEHAVSFYVTNGACIKAAIELGFAVEPMFQAYSLLGGKVRHPKPLNVWIGVSRRSVHALVQALRSKDEHQ